MASYFENYGEGEERRNKRIVGAVLALLGLILVATLGYFYARNFKEKKKMAGFREVLEKKDYQGAYQYWGCTPEKPCRDYNFEKFMEDWGPKSGHTEFGSMKVVRTVTCKEGYGVGWQFGTDPMYLWVVREDQSLSYDPFPRWNQTWLAALFNDCNGLKRALPDAKPL